VLSVLWTACNQPEPGPAKVPVPPTSHTSTSPIENVFQKGVDKSPMDLSYYPVDYPILKIQNKVSGLPVARVIYSRPQKNDRTIFGSVVKYGVPWRLGANEATEIEFFQDVTIDKQKVSKGRYVLYCIPYDETWTLVLNTDLYTWGLKIDSTRDAYKFSIPIAKTNYPFELMTIQFRDAAKGMELVMEWDSVRAVLPINY